MPLKMFAAFFFNIRAVHKVCFPLLVSLLLILSDEYVYGSGGRNGQYSLQEETIPNKEEQNHRENLPPLIQATTLEEDYRAITNLGLAFTPLLQEEDFEQTFQNVLRSCVRLQANGHYGSGSIYLLREDEIIIVSNQHLLQYWDEESFVTLSNGAVESGTVTGISGEADVGFLSVPTQRFSWQELLELGNVRPLEDEAESLQSGSRLLLVDMASDAFRPVMKQGEIISPRTYLADFGMEMLYGTGDALPGMSGSGVFDGCGNYLGMLTGATMQGEIAAVPASVIEEEYLAFQDEWLAEQ